METPDYQAIEKRLQAEASTARPSGLSEQTHRQNEAIRYRVLATYRLQDAVRLIADLLTDPTLPYTRQKAEHFIASLSPSES